MFLEELKRVVGCLPCTLCVGTPAGLSLYGHMHVCV